MIFSCFVAYLYILVYKIITGDYTFDMVYFLCPIVILVLVQELNKYKLHQLTHQNKRK